MKKFFKDNNIEFYSLIPLSKCKVVKKYLLDKNGFSDNASVIMMLFPYRSKIKPVNLTVYASVNDYHGYVSELEIKLQNYIKSKYPSALFKVFADHSPIDEVHAACISGLGFIGDNGLLINEKYSSFVFLGECITNLTPEELGLEYARDCEIKTCLHCGKCKKACPCGCIMPRDEMPIGIKQSECLSAVTQKKGELTSEEIELIIKNGSIWGCDICQNACPYTVSASLTPIEYFQRDIISCLDINTLSSLSSEEFKKRPFAWRGYDTVLRNVNLYEKYMKEENNG